MVHTCCRGETESVPCRGQPSVEGDVLAREQVCAAATRGLDHSRPTGRVTRGVVCDRPHNASTSTHVIRCTPHTLEKALHSPPELSCIVGRELHPTGSGQSGIRELLH